MSEWFSQLLAALAASPVLQGLVAALATFVLEDPTTVGSGLLVADGKMAFATALVGVATGIAVGDLGLYGLGRLAGPRVVRSGLVSQGRMDRASRWFERNLVTAVVLSRFVPGMRLPTYVGAGALRAPLGRFMAVVVAASLVWTFLLLTLTVQIGAAVLPLLGRWRWPVAAIAVCVLVAVQRRAARAAATEEPPAERVLSPFELWPPWLFYIPVAAYWLWLGVRHRGMLLPTAANPKIATGGLVGESKSAILDLVDSDHRRWLAPYTTVTAPAGADDLDAAVVAARRAMGAAGLCFPVVAKPDVGHRGAGVQPLSDEQAVRAYLAAFPPRGLVMLQELVGPAAGARPDDPVEAGVMYWRRPGDDHGSVPSITLKLLPHVVGDGERSLAELIEADPRASRLASVYRERHRTELDRVLTDGELHPLVFAGNHCQGAVFRNGTDLLTPELAARMDELAHAVPELWFARFDIRFPDLGSLLRGEDFKIIEINGAGAEATHIWDAGMGLGEAYSVLFTQFRTLFEIGAANRRRGFRPATLRQVIREVLRYRRLAREYPPTA